MNIIQNIALGLTVFLSFCNACIMLAAFKSFLGKPKATMQRRISELEEEMKKRISDVEEEVKEIKESLQKGNDKFLNLGEIVEALLQSTQALIEFEIQYCLLENKELSKGLEDAKANLSKCLSKIRG